jgi:hypothetical protein
VKEYRHRRSISRRRRRRRCYASKGREKKNVEEGEREEGAWEKKGRVRKSKALKLARHLEENNAFHCSEPRTSWKA